MEKRGLVFSYLQKEGPGSDDFVEESSQSDERAIKIASGTIDPRTGAMRQTYVSNYLAVQHYGVGCDNRLESLGQSNTTDSRFCGKLLLALRPCIVCCGAAISGGARAH